jgi:hypothetical protein
MSVRTTLQQLQAATMTSTRLAAVSYLARYSSRTHTPTLSSRGCGLRFG